MIQEMETTQDKDIFARASLLLGKPMMDALKKARVILFGVGGVGSWCAEGLIRSGLTHLTLVDPDCVCASNVNRQSMASTRTLGQVKVEALKQRLLEINPDAQIEAIQASYSEQKAANFDLAAYDYIVDAIDSLKDKAALILHACETKAVFFSSMGAALKLDPTLVKVAEFWKVRGCPLGAILRKRFRKNGTLPRRKFLCVYDEEVLPNLGSSEQYANGSTVSITAIFGFTLSGLILKDIYRKVLAINAA